MLSPELTDTLTRCEARYRCGLYDDALAELDELAANDRCEPPVVSMEARLCMATGLWDRGLSLAYACEFCDDEEYKITAAEFYAAYASHLCGEGRVTEAKTYVREASSVWPAIRLQMLEDHGLAELFGG